MTLVGQQDRVVDEHADLGEADHQHEDGGRAAAVLVHVAQLGGSLLTPGGQRDAHRRLVDGGAGAVAHPGLPEPPGHLLRQDGQLLQRQPSVQIALRSGQQESGTQIFQRSAYFYLQGKSQVPSPNRVKDPIVKLRSQRRSSSKLKDLVCPRGLGLTLKSHRPPYRPLDIVWDLDLIEVIIFSRKAYLCKTLRFKSHLDRFVPS